LIEATDKFWETAYRQNIGKMIGICYRYTTNRQLAEDLAHDAFLKAIDKSASFEGKGCFDAWLRRIVVNHVLQYMRDQRKKEYFDDWIQHESSVLQIEDTASNANPVEQVAFSEKELLETINDLPENHRLVFNLYVIDQFTHSEIGRELGISSGTSKSHLARARKRIKKLLAQKAKNKRDEKDQERGFLVLFFPYKLGNIDQRCREQFNNFAIPPKKTLAIDSTTGASAPVVKSRAFTSSNYITSIASIGIISTVVFFAVSSLQWQSRKDNTETKLAKSSIHNEDKDLKLFPESREELKGDETQGKAKTIDDRENNSLVADSNTATIFTDSIILSENIKNKSMKTLDSLGVMLLVSSSIVFDSVGQPNYKTHEEFQRSNENKILAEKGRSIETIDVIEREKPDVKSKVENGTFYASRLFWSGENNEVYLKGKVRVKFSSNNFKGNGSFAFLGTVHLLIFNDKPAILDSTVKLSEQPYHLTRLDSKEATKKYGEKGRQGAVEISATE
jgi:RNA polymerase sigma factor (sigma-70 family)